jgi:hypothetical protein
MHLPIPDAVAALIALDLPHKLTAEDVNVGNYGWHRREFARVYHVTLPDLRSQPAKRMAEHWQAAHGVAPVKKPAPVTFDGPKQAGFRLTVLQPGAPRPDWAGGLVPQCSRRPRRRCNARTTSSRTRKADSPAPQRPVPPQPLPTGASQARTAAPRRWRSDHRGAVARALADHARL